MVRIEIYNTLVNSINYLLSIGASDISKRLDKFYNTNVINEEEYQKALDHYMEKVKEEAMIIPFTKKYEDYEIFTEDELITFLINLIHRKVADSTLFKYDYLEDVQKQILKAFRESFKNNKLGYNINEDTVKKIIAQQVYNELREVKR